MKCSLCKKRVQISKLYEIHNTYSVCKTCYYKVFPQPEQEHLDPNIQSEFMGKIMNFVKGYFIYLKSIYS